MEFKISELMRLIEDDSVTLEEYDAASADKIKEAVMSKIHKEEKKTIPARRWGRTLLIAAVITCLMLAMAVTAGADPLSIFGHAREEQRYQQEADEKFKQSMQEKGEDYQTPDNMDTVKLDSIVTVNDQTVDINRFTKAAEFIDTPESGGEYTGPELKGIRVHLKESYYDGKDLRLGVALESLDGTPLSLVPMSEGNFADTEDVSAAHQEWYIRDHVYLSDGTDIGYHGTFYTPEGMYLNFSGGIAQEAQGQDEIQISLVICSYIDDPNAPEKSGDPDFGADFGAQETVTFTIPNTAK